MLRFHTPLVKPDRRFARIRLPDKDSRLRPRKVWTYLGFVDSCALSGTFRKLLGLVASLLRSESPRFSFHRPGGAGAEPPLLPAGAARSRLARWTQDRRFRLSLSIGYPPVHSSFRIRWARDSRV